MPEALSVNFENIKLMRLGGVQKGGSGCICPESTLLRALVMHIVLARDEVVVMDMEDPEPEWISVSADEIEHWPEDGWY